MTSRGAENLLYNTGVLSYELAKELKDAGYPGLEYLHTLREEIYPTLSELIEACGDSIMGIYFKADNPEGRVSAWTRRWLTDDQLDKDVERYGHTPEEAVARLWLALNKK